MRQKSLFLALAVVALCFLVLAGIFLFDLQRNSSASVATEQVVLDTKTLAQFDGKNGHKCYVAIDGNVYDMTNFALWQNGIHSTSEGRARCGQDLSQVMPTAPHGKSKLSIMPKVGTFKN